MAQLTRLRIAFAGLLTICLFAILSSTLLILHSADLNRRNTAAFVPLLEQAEGFERDVLNARIAFIYYVTIDKPGSLRAGWDRYGQAQADLKELHQLTAATGQERLLAPRLDALDSAWTAYRNRLDSILVLVGDGTRSGPAFTQSVTEWAAEGTTLVNAARDLVKTSTALSRAQSEQTGDLLRFSTWITGLNGAICLVLCVAPLFFLRRMLDWLPRDQALADSDEGRARGGPQQMRGNQFSGNVSSRKVVLVLAGMLALIVIVLGSGVSALFSVIRLSRAQAANAHSEQVLLSAESLRALAYAAESDTRGYVFSGRQVLLVSQKTDMLAAWNGLSKLGTQVEAEPEQRKHIDLLREALSQRFAVLQEISHTREQFGPDAVLKVLASGQSLGMKHKLEEQISVLEAAEYDLIANGKLQADRAAEMSKVLIVFAALPASLSLVLLSMVTTNLLVRSKHLQQQLSFQAEHDVLTGLPNRQSLDKRLGEALHQARRQKTSFAVIGIDLDRFKQVNDRFGHQAGDAFLKQVASRLRSAMRQTDTLIRVGGDEFLCLVQGVRRAEAELVAQKLIASQGEPIQLGGVEITASVSLGFAVYPDHGSTAEELAVHADQALYRAKTAGRNRFCCYEESEEEIRSQKIQASLDSALREQRFHLVYQPQYTSAGDLRGFEALLRLRDPELGAISPAEFIPLAERDQLIVSIGDWVLREVCATFAGWVRAGLEPGIIAVNVSAAQFAEKTLPARVLDALRSSGLPGTRLELEVTESLVMCDPEAAAQQMAHLARHGVRFAIDDFGTGFSSLSRINQLPIKMIKIDRSFVQGLDAKASSRPIVEATLALSKALDVETVAEGVETEAQSALLERLGCSYLQGYYFSRPMQCSAVEALLLTRAGQAQAAFRTKEVFVSAIM